MNEVALGLIAVGSLGIPMIASIFSMLGGRSTEELAKWKLDFVSNRTWGRWIAPLFLSGACIGLSFALGSFRWGFFASLLTFKAASHMGHGYNPPPGEPPLKTLLMKILRRSLSSLAWTAALVALAAFSGHWWILIGQSLVSLVVCNIWGIANPKPAPQEEAVIAFFKYCFAPFLI